MLSESVLLEVLPVEIPKEMLLASEQAAIPEVEPDLTVEEPAVPKVLEANGTIPKTDPVDARKEFSHQAKAHADTSSDEPENEKAIPIPAVASPSAPASARALPTSVGLDDVAPARLLQNSPPDYPREAIEQAWSGRVLLRLSISAAGKVTSVNVVESSGHQLLDRAAIEAVREWIFEPAHKNNQPVQSSALLPVRFQAQ